MERKTQDYLSKYGLLYGERSLLFSFPGSSLLTRIGSVIGYQPNYYNYINWRSSDPGGMLRFLTDELQAAEDANERGVLIFLIFVLTDNLMSLDASVWIIGHVLSGWDGTDPLPNPTNLCTYELSIPE